MMYFIGIDPGQTGAVALITEDRALLRLVDWPGDEIAAARLIYNIKADVMDWVDSPSLTAAIEKVSAMPKQGVTSTFKFGTNYGIWKGILAALEIPFEEVRPQAWQKGVISKAQDKFPSIAAAGRMFPSAELHGPRGGKKDGRSDALLIAWWCLRNFSGSIANPAINDRKRPKR